MPKKSSPKTLKMHAGKDDAALLERPEWVTGVAADKWDEVLPKLLRRGDDICDLDVDALANYCQAFADKLFHRDRIEKAGWEWISANQSLCPHPAVADYNKAIADMKRWGDVLLINKNRRKAVKPKTQSPEIPRKSKPA